MLLGVITLRVVAGINVNITVQGSGFGLGLAYFRDLCENNAHHN